MSVERPLVTVTKLANPSAVSTALSMPAQNADVDGIRKSCHAAKNTTAVSKRAEPFEVVLSSSIEPDWGIRGGSNLRENFLLFPPVCLSRLRLQSPVVFGMEGVRIDLSSDLSNQH